MIRHCGLSEATKYSELVIVDRVKQSRVYSFWIASLSLAMTRDI